MNATETKIVSVWLDRISDDHAWIVDTDIAGGGESRTLKWFPATREGRKQAVAYAEKEAERRGYPLEIQSR